MSGKAFRSVDSRSLDKEIRRGLVNMKLATSKKAGTASNQNASAATMWLAQAAGNYGSLSMAWAGASDSGGGFQGLGLN